MSNQSIGLMRTCVAALHYLSRYDATMVAIADEAQCSVSTVRRAIKMLQKVLPIVHVRYDQRMERVDYWRLERALGSGEAEAIAASLFLAEESGQALLERARVSL